MPGIASIHTDAKGVAHWKIQAEIPHVGQMIQRFEVFLTENSEERVEWFPLRRNRRTSFATRPIFSQRPGT